MKTIELTEADFKMIVDALDHLPEKGTAGDIMATLITSAIDKGEDGNASKTYEQLRKRRDKEKEILTEEVRILQGKLIQFKRYLIENNLMSQASDLIR